MSAKNNLRTIGKTNMENVLKLLMVEKELSRGDLAKRLGVSKMTITNIISELKGHGYVQEEKSNRSTPSNGPIPMVISIVPNSLLTIGVHISFTEITVQLVDVVDGILYQTHARVDNIDSNQQLAKRIRGVIYKVLEENPEIQTKIIGIGITYSGGAEITGANNNFSASQIKKTEIDLKNSLEKEFGITIAIGNEIQGAMIAELVFGKEVGQEKVYYMNASKQIRGGFINNYIIIHGACGLSGEIAHLTVKYDGPLCLCGSRGCYNLYAGIEVLLKHSKCHSIDELHLKIQERDPLALRIIEEYIQITTVVFTNIVNLYDPASILVGGDLTKLDKSIFRKIERLLNERIIYRKERYIKVRMSSIEKAATIMGAAMLVYENWFVCKQ